MDVPRMGVGGWVGGGLGLPSVARRATLLVPFIQHLYGTHHEGLMFPVATMIVWVPILSLG